MAAARDSDRAVQLFAVSGDMDMFAREDAQIPEGEKVPSENDAVRTALGQGPRILLTYYQADENTLPYGHAFSYVGFAETYGRDELATLLESAIDVREAFALTTQFEQAAQQVIESMTGRYKEYLAEVKAYPEDSVFVYHPGDDTRGPRFCKVEHGQAVFDADGNKVWPAPPPTRGKTLNNMP